MPLLLADVPHEKLNLIMANIAVPYFSTGRRALGVLPMYKLAYRPDTEIFLADMLLKLPIRTFFLIPLFFIAKTISFSGPGKHKVIYNPTFVCRPTLNTLSLHVSICIITQRMYWNSHHRNPLMRHECRWAILLRIIAIFIQHFT